MKLKRFDYVNLVSAVAAVLGLILAAFGCLVLSKPTDIGVNLALSPVVYAGVVLIVASLIGSIIGNVQYEKQGLNRKLATVAIYAAVIAVVVVTFLVAYTILIPVLHPTNG